MKSVLVYVFVFALVGGGLCGRLRRQAPPIPASGAEAASASAASLPTTGDILNGVIAGKIAKMQAESALGTPIDLKAMDKIFKLSMVIGITGGELSKSNKDAMEQLLSDSAVAAPSSE